MKKKNIAFLIEYSVDYKEWTYLYILGNDYFVSYNTVRNFETDEIEDKHLVKSSYCNKDSIILDLFKR